MTTSKKVSGGLVLSGVAFIFSVFSFLLALDVRRVHLRAAQDTNQYEWVDMPDMTNGIGIWYSNKFRRLKQEPVRVTGSLFPNLSDTNQGHVVQMLLTVPGVDPNVSQSRIRIKGEIHTQGTNRWIPLPSNSVVYIVVSNNTPNNELLESNHN